MDPKKSFWETLPGMLTAIGGAIAAVAALLTALYTTGLIGSREVSAPTPTPTPAPTITVQSFSPTQEVASPSKPPVITVQSPSSERESPVQTGSPKNFFIIAAHSKRRNDWARLGDDTWIEKYDDGRTNEFRVSGRLANDNCIGTLLYRVSIVDLEI